MTRTVAATGPISALEFGQGLGVRRTAQDASRLFLGFEQRGSVHESFGRVPHEIGDGFLGVDPEKMLQDAQEGYLLRRFSHLAQDGVEDVQVRVDVDALGPLHLRFVRFSLFVKDVNLDGQVSVATRVASQIIESGQQLEADEFVADAKSLFQLRRRDDNAVDERHQRRLVFDGGRIA